MGCRLHLDFRDIFPENVNEIFGLLGKFVAPIFSNLERISISQASSVSLVSDGFLGYYKSKYPQKSFEVFPNGIDKEFLVCNFKKEVKRDKKIIVYAGNIGEGQGLDKIIPKFSDLIRESFEFRIIGSGNRVLELSNAVQKKGLSNVQVLPPIERKLLLKEYQEADVLFLHLNDYVAFERVLPSKIFEYGATEKPILAGVTGYARKFILKHVPNAGVFDPIDADGAAAVLDRLSLEETDRSEFKRAFARDRIMDKMVNRLV